MGASGSGPQGGRDPGAEDRSAHPAPGRRSLETAHLWVDLVSKVVGGLAVVVAAWWTYTNFTVERTHDPTLEVSVEPSVRPLDDAHVLLNVDVFLRNVGKVAVLPRFDAVAGGDAGLEISIVEMEPLRRSSADTAATDGDPDVPWFDWTSGDGAPTPILFKRNLLSSNEDYRHARYRLNPGVRYREPFACVVSRGRLYAIRARFWTDEGSVADLVYVDTFLTDEIPAGRSGDAAVP